MAESEFIDTVEKALKDKGVLDQLTCQVRAEILQVLKSSLKVKQVKNSIPESTNNFLINELIKGQLISECLLGLGCHRFSEKLTNFCPRI